MTDQDAEDAEALASRVQGRLDRIGLSAADATEAAGLPAGYVDRLLGGREKLPRGKLLQRLADTLGASVSYLVGLEPDTPVPDEYLADDQGDLGLLAVDEDALLRGYRRMDVPARAALLLLVQRIAPDPVVLENKPKLLSRR